jgi:RNA polymerase sigma factor (sigma-70 family)
MDRVQVVVVESPEVDLLPLRVGFEALYRDEYPGLVAVATAMTGDLRDGEDLVQDTMVKTFLGWRKVARLERPGAWCHRVLLNACRSWWRRRGVEHRYLERHRRAETWVDPPSVEVLAFWDVVRTLPVRPRRAVALYFAGERTTAEIAAILGCPEGTVRSDLSRARAVLADALGY